MTKQTKWALGVLAFVVTATVARRVGQYEVLDQVEKQVQQVEVEMSVRATPPPGGSTFDSMFSTLAHDPLRGCILHGNDNACHEVAQKLADRRPQASQSDPAPDPFWSQFPPADRRPQ